MANSRPTEQNDELFHKSLDATERFVPRTDENGRVNSRPASEVIAADLDND